jgi:endonuclease/exonuclease/phosphatase family metal-dependent hydrolase
LRFAADVPITPRALIVIVTDLAIDGLARNNTGRPPVGGAPPRGRGKTMQLSVLSTNLKGAIGTADQPRRLELHLQTAAEVEPAIWLVQEAKGLHLRDGEQVFAIERALGMRALFALAADTSCHTIIFVDENRVRPLGFGTGHSPKAWHALGIAQLEIIELEQPIRVCSVHLSPFAIADHFGEIGILNALLEYGDPVILGGDFNSVPPGDTPDVRPSLRARRIDPDTGEWDRRPGKLLQASGYVDVAAHLADETGEESYRAPTGTGGIRHDQFWVSERLVPAIRGYRVIDTTASREASDHVPIELTLDLGMLASTSIGVDGRIVSELRGGPLRRPIGPR